MGNSFRVEKECKDEQYPSNLNNTQDLMKNIVSL